EPAEMDHNELGLGMVADPPRSCRDPADRQVAAGAASHFDIKRVDLERINAPVGTVNLRLEYQANRVVREDSVEIDGQGLDALFPDAAAVAVPWQIAGGLSQGSHELGLELALQMLGQVDRAGRIIQALNRLDAAQLVVEPAARGEHQHRVALHFQNSQG